MNVNFDFSQVIIISLLRLVLLDSDNILRLAMQSFISQCHNLKVFYVVTQNMIISNNSALSHTKYYMGLNSEPERPKIAILFIDEIHHYFSTRYK